MICKSALLGFCLLLTSIAHAQSIAVTETGATFALTWGGKSRLTGGTGAVQDKAGAVSVQKNVRDGVALLTLSTGKTEIQPQAFAGVFFDAIPRLS